MKLNVSELTAPKPKSWADMVKGGEKTQVQEETKNLVVPGERGSRRVLCTGELLMMLGHYGWIMSLAGIDHPEKNRHGGRIYLKISDVRPGCVLTQGSLVSFYLYADADGLGAEDCHPLESVNADFPELSTRGLAKNACSIPTAPAVLAPSPAAAVMVQPATHSMTKWHNHPPLKWQRNARPVASSAPVTLVPVDAVSQWLEGARSGQRFSPPPWARAHRPPEADSDQSNADILKLNFACLLDDSDDSDSDDDNVFAPQGQWSSLAARCGNAMNRADISPPVSTSVPISAPTAAKSTKRLASYKSDMSTSAGETDSDSGMEMPPGLQPAPKTVGMKRGLRSGVVVPPPPGLEGLVGLRPPPGLELPSPSVIA